MARKLKVKKPKLSAEEKKIIEETIEENYSYYLLNYALHTVMKVFMTEFKIKRQIEKGKVDHINYMLLDYGFPEWSDIINRTDRALERLFNIEDKEPLKNKKVIIIGDRDGIPGLAIEECVKTIEGTEIVFASTECFVWTAAGAMDLENQKRVKEAAEKYGNENVAVLLGASEAEAAGLAAETVTVGDPTFAGPLAGVELHLAVYHIVEEEVKSQVDPAVYEEQVGMMEMVLDVDAISEEMKDVRGE